MTLTWNQGNFHLVSAETKFGTYLIRETPKGYLWELWAPHHQECLICSLPTSRLEEIKRMAQAHLDFQILSDSLKPNTRHEKTQLDL